MHFRKLELVGFKSFADKTEIRFEPGVTAIVGPNGCGKSNISDAIRWVLGEQSAKSLRGLSMEDVIFKGSALKEPLNLAEVSLTFSNEARILPIDYEEVTITRRLYRSGESEYLINKNIMRLKDIQELLLGTGIGTESYSVIEQGKMDVILNSKPEERREIFEEAAGITKYKSKKKEALRKLEQTETNLLRVGDIIQEVKRQIGSIERQAKKAESYKAEFEKLKELELSVASREFFIFDAERQEKERALKELKTAEGDCLSAVEVLEKDCQEKRAALERLDGLLKQTDAWELSASAEIRKNQDRILLDRERIGELSEKREGLARQMEQTRKRVENFQTEYENLRTEFELARKEEAEAHLVLESMQNGLHAVSEAAQKQIAEEKSAQAKRAELAVRREHARAELAGVRARVEALALRREKLRSEQQAFADERQEAVRALQGDAGVQNQAADAGLETRIAGFVSRLKSVFRSFFEKKISDVGPVESVYLESEVRTFIREIRQSQLLAADSGGRSAVLQERKKKLDQELSALAAELSQLEAEERVLLTGQQKLEQETEQSVAEDRNLGDGISASQELLIQKSAEREALLVQLAERRAKQDMAVARREKTERDRMWVLESKATQEELLAALEKDIQASVMKKETLEVECVTLEERLKQLSAERDELLKRTETMRRERAAAAAHLQKLEDEKQKTNAFLGQAREKAHASQMESTEIRFAIERLKERIFNSYQIDLVVQGSVAETATAAGEELQGREAFDIEGAKTRIQAQRERLNKMGPVNLVAIEEHQELKQRFDFLTQQAEDLAKAKEDLHKAILQINRTTKELFVTTFAKIQKHFTDYYRLLFGGGTAELILTDETDVLESGIEIVAKPPGKKLQNISLLSGGEKALTAIALLFALFKVKPSPFCILDEIDAPLDESNVDRFCRVLRDFIAQSQFILVTHNKRTIHLADALYGITMADSGASKIVSVRLENKDQAAHPRSKQAAVVL